MASIIDYMKPVEGSVGTLSMAAPRPEALHQLAEWVPMEQVDRAKAADYTRDVVNNNENIVKYIFHNYLPSLTNDPTCDAASTEAVSAAAEWLSSCPSGGGKKRTISQSGGDASENLLETLSWGITGAIIATFSVGIYVGWGYIEGMLVSSWIVPRLCTFSEIVRQGVVGAGQGMSCGDRSKRYAVVSKVLASIFVTSGGVAIARGGPVAIKEWVRERLNGMVGMVGAVSPKNLLVILGLLPNDGSEDIKEEIEKFDDWLKQQEPIYDEGAIETPKQLHDAIQLAKGRKEEQTKTANGGEKVSVAVPLLTPAQQPWSTTTWRKWWDRTEATRGGRSGKRRKSRHIKNKKSKNKKSKNKKSKRNMSKRKTFKRRRNKRNKTRR
jgi:hypothetical protein